MKQTEAEFVADYDDAIARRIARDAWLALNPTGMHTNGPTRVVVEVSQLLRILTRWKRTAGPASDAQQEKP